MLSAPKHQEENHAKAHRERLGGAAAPAHRVQRRRRRRKRDHGSDRVDTAGETQAGSVDLTPEEEAYCAELAALPDSGDPGFDAFFAEHPDPTLADWAEFLPGVVDSIRAGLADFDAVDPPASLTDAHQDVSEAMTAVADSLDAALTAAEAGDQAAYDAAEAENQGGLSATMEEAMSALGGVCGLGE